MDSFAPTFSSSKARLITEYHGNVRNKTYPPFTATLSNDSLLAVLSNQLVDCESDLDKKLRLYSLDILSWILSCVSCSDDREEEDVQRALIINSTHIQIAFDRIITIIAGEKDDSLLVNLCIFVVMQQSIPQLMDGRMYQVLEALTGCLYSTVSTVPQKETWKQPILACSALCNLMEQRPEKVFTRHHLWGVDVFLLLVDSFSLTSNADLQKGDSSSSSSSSSSSNNSSSSNSSGCTSNESVAGSFSLSPYSAIPHSRLLPIAVSALRLLCKIPLGGMDPLIPIALSSSGAAMDHIR